MAKGKQKVYEEPAQPYIVVTDPFRMPRSSRQQRHFDETAAWLNHVFGSQDAVDTIYTMRTRTEIIVAVSEDVDIAPALGAHRWSMFMPHMNPADGDKVSCIFRYNYKTQGDPLSRQWIAMYPETPVNITFVSPYPEPASRANAHPRSTIWKVPAATSAPRDPYDLLQLCTTDYYR
ncbi:hypothetical protein OE88DRAFT_1660051 [Heliocybe sulcata]|uniref:Uncharacterized protein n=1 Tax=Heliocybe sulcata TaxID=5364 RepID=A0A5C3MZL3_9AGAM|nr:hypothetical protein OE88DRAFT_1660051 [Heliocybe sulcata]